jgi:hypothetical protein
MNDQEIRIKALEIAAILTGSSFSVLFQSDDGQLKMLDNFERRVKGVERYIKGEKPIYFTANSDELDETINRWAESKI